MAFYKKSVLAGMVLTPAHSLIIPTATVNRRTVGNKKIAHLRPFRLCGHPILSTKRQMADSDLLEVNYDDGEGLETSFIKEEEILNTFETFDTFEGVDRLGGETIISLDDSVIPLDTETKERADIIAENIVTEIINSEEPIFIPSEFEENVSQEIQIVQEPTTTTSVKRGSPGVRKIIKFAIPAIGVWLCGPLLSLIDTAAVGLKAGTLQQAGLNPAVAICDYSALLMAFLYTASTNLIATAHEEEKNSVTKPHTASTLISALQLSGFVGLLLAAVLISTSKQAVLALIGSGADPVVFSAAVKYVNIRALGMPAAAIIGSAQSACLGMQDIKSPLFVLLAAAVINFLGDAIFVGQKAAWIGGAAGAAWATVFSQYAALILFTKWLIVKPKRPVREVPSMADYSGGSLSDNAKRVRVTEKILKLSSLSPAKVDSKRYKIKSTLMKLHNSIHSNDSEDSTKSKRSNLISKLFVKVRNGNKTKNKTDQKEGFSVRGFLAGRFQSRDLLKLPQKSHAEEFYPYVIPVTITSVGRVSSYVAMAHVVASSLGTLSMAAQQIITSCFYCLTPIADSLSLTAQSFLPVVYERSNTPEGAKDLRTTSIDFLKAGTLFGGVIALMASFIPLLGGFFTSDLQVLSLVNSVVPTITAIFFTHGIMCATEGVILGQKDLSFLGRAYTSFFFAVPYFMLRVKKAALAGKPASLRSLWQVFLGYNIFRSFFWMFRTRFLSNKRQSMAAEVEQHERISM